MQGKRRFLLNDCRVQARARRNEWLGADRQHGLHKERLELGVSVMSTETDDSSLLGIVVLADRVYLTPGKQRSPPGVGRGTSQT